MSATRSRSSTQAKSSSAVRRGPYRGRRSIPIRGRCRPPIRRLPARPRGSSRCRTRCRASRRSAGCRAAVSRHAAPRPLPPAGPRRRSSASCPRPSRALRRGLQPRRARGRSAAAGRTSGHGRRSGARGRSGGGSIIPDAATGSAGGRRASMRCAPPASRQARRVRRHSSASRDRESRRWRA